jgi:hypothetical protein
MEEREGGGGTVVEEGEDERRCLPLSLGRCKVHARKSIHNARYGRCQSLLHHAYMPWS